MNKRIVGLLGIVTLVAIIPATVWHDHAEDRWTKWVYDYQPLIAGAFAIFAAYLTVNTMRETDDRQELRHQELMRLSLKRDQLIARRAVHPQVLDIAECERDLEKIEAQISSAGYDAFIQDCGTAGHNPLYVVCANLTDIIGRDQLSAVKTLLDHEGYRAFQLLEKELKELLKSNQTVTSDGSQYAMHSMRPNFPNIKGKKLLDELKTTRLRLHQLNESIVSLAAEYD
ncbi:hypothetical protein [Brucella pseudogrignonensis]|uniref:hypothetical protein n=1 Tax=Brucella pseudogrignonensis TaxID=419475 RepID=UPI003ED0E906